LIAEKYTLFIPSPAEITESELGARVEGLGFRV
jgi:hypothetical protein